ncbi:hypothetical protein F5Y02DRAFT_430417 [Annulohypoxylon stygium]|nr:hypothetical protein F5Y02DRAFT_430417 [Annulohypoxylon stygium]
MNTRTRYPQQQQQQQQQEVGYPGSSNCESTTYITNQTTQPSSLEWPTPPNILGSEILSEIQMSHLDSEDPVHFATNGIGLWSSNTSSPNHLSLNTALGNNAEQMDAIGVPNIQSGPTGQVEDSNPSDPQRRLPLSTQGNYVQRLWALQVLLDQQLERVRPNAANSILEACDGGQKSTRSDDSPFPVDHILSSTQTFLDMLNGWTSLLPTGDKAACRLSERRSVSSSDTAVTEGCSSGVSPTNLPISEASGKDREVNCALKDMNTPTICMVVSCYSRLIEIYDEAFKYIREELETYSQHKAAPRSRLPLFQLGTFQLKNSYLFQKSIVVKILLYNLRSLKTFMGIDGERTIAGDEGMRIPGGEETCKSACGNDKITKVIMALEADGPGGHSQSINSLRGNIENVTKLLEGVSP